MKTLLIGDLHFGIKNNSVSWLEMQLQSFDDQIFKVIEEKHIEFFVETLKKILKGIM